jgi:acetyltransferase-like isoleucine patch superfamily enzyme
MFIRRYNTFLFMKTSKASISLDAFATGGWDNVFIGRNTRINSNFNLRNKDGVLEIGQNCLIASKVTIIVNSYDIRQKKISIRNMKHSLVKIGNNVLIGTNAVIMPGVEIGEGAVIGANSVVTKDIDPFSVNAGNPAKKISLRSQNDTN